MAGISLLMARFLRRSLPVAAAAVAVSACAAGSAVALSAPAAPGAVAPGWRIAQFLPGAVPGGFSVPGKNDAWLAGETCGSDSLCDRVFVRRWDGAAWRTLKLPRALTATAGEAGIAAVAATSASNAWVFNLRETGPAQYTTTTALRWTGKGWGAPARLAAYINAAVALSADNAWAFGSPAADPQGGYIAHFNGRSWSRASFPVLVQSASALSADDIWLAGTAADARGPSVVIGQWNGKRWRSTALPDLGLPPNSWTGADVTAVTPRDAWALVSARGAGTLRSYLLHWNGKAWTRMRSACPGTAVTYAPDGQGGLWLASATDSGAGWFCHYTGGRWSKTAVPKRAGERPGIDGMALIPGTRALWALGGFDADEGEAIFKYGP